MQCFMWQLCDRIVRIEINTFMKRTKRCSQFDSIRLFVWQLMWHLWPWPRPHSSVASASLFPGLSLGLTLPWPRPPTSLALLTSLIWDGLCLICLVVCRDGSGQLPAVRLFQWHWQGRRQHRSHRHAERTRWLRERLLSRQACSQ